MLTLVGTDSNGNPIYSDGTNLFDSNGNSLGPVPIDPTVTSDPSAGTDGNSPNTPGVASPSFWSSLTAAIGSASTAAATAYTASQRNLAGYPPGTVLNSAGLPINPLTGLPATATSSLSTLLSGNTLLLLVVFGGLIFVVAGGKR